MGNNGKPTDKLVFKINATVWNGSGNGNSCMIKRNTFDLNTDLGTRELFIF